MTTTTGGPGRRAVLAGGALAAFAAVGTAAAAAPASTPGEVRVIAEITAKPGSEAALLGLLRTFAQGVRSEPGCLHYELLQVAAEPARFFTVERWSDKASIDAHMQTPRIQALTPQVVPLLAAAPVQLFLDEVV